MTQHYILVDFQGSARWLQKWHLKIAQLELMFDNILLCFRSTLPMWLPKESPSMSRSHIPWKVTLGVIFGQTRPGIASLEPRLLENIKTESNTTRWGSISTDPHQWLRWWLFEMVLSEPQSQKENSAYGPRDRVSTTFFIIWFNMLKRSWSRPHAAGPSQKICISSFIYYYYHYDYHSFFGVLGALP